MPGLFEILFQIGISQPETELVEETDSATVERASGEQQSEKDHIHTSTLFEVLPVSIFPPTHRVDLVPAMVPVAPLDYLPESEVESGPASSAGVSGRRMTAGPSHPVRTESSTAIPSPPFAFALAAPSPGEPDRPTDIAPLRPERTRSPRTQSHAAQDPQVSSRVALGHISPPAPAETPRAQVTGPADVRVTVPPKESPQRDTAVSFSLTPVEPAKPTPDLRPDAREAELVRMPPAARASTPVAVSGPAPQSGSSLGAQSDPERGSPEHPPEHRRPEVLPQLDSAAAPTNFGAIATNEAPSIEIPRPVRTPESSPPPSVRVADDSPPPAPPPPRISALSLQVEDASGTRVDLHVRSTPERIEMAVATPDTTLSDDLKRQLPELAAAVERQGYELTPGSSKPGSGWPDGDAPGQRSQHRQQPNRPRPRRTASTPEFTLAGVSA